MDSIRRELMELLRRLARLHLGDLRQRAAGAQVQPVHLQSLLYLRDANRYSNTPQALTEYLGSTKGTVSQSLLWLYRRGLVERRADQRDGRVVRLALSRRGEALLDSATGETAWLSAAGAISDEQARSALDVLTTLLRALQLQRGGRSFGVCHTCAHFRHEGADRLRCGLTGEELSRDDSLKICREHALSEATQPPGEASQNSRK